MYVYIYRRARICSLKMLPLRELYPVKNVHKCDNSQCYDILMMVYRCVDDHRLRLMHNENSVEVNLIMSFTDQYSRYQNNN